MGNTIVDKNISIDINHIDGFKLETSSGTKKVKEKFHKEAVKKRNEYICKRKTEFLNYQSTIYSFMKDRVYHLMPKNNSNKHVDDENELKLYEKLIKYSNPCIGSDYKLELLSLVSQIKDNNSMSLEDINDIISTFIGKFSVFGIKLSADDFNYSMFIHDYMVNFFSKSINTNVNDVLRHEFEKIYFECPDFLKHLKLSLWYIIEKYKKNINNYINNETNSLIGQEQLKKDNIVETYVDLRKAYEEEIKCDEFLNLNTFLCGNKNILDYLKDSTTRKNNFNSFVINKSYDELSDDEKSKYLYDILNLSNELDELKKYYRYEFIIKDMISKYGKISEYKGKYSDKLKEITKEDNVRKKIYSSYLKAMGIGFLAKYDKEKVNLFKLKMNEQLIKLYGLYKELHDLEIFVKIESNLSEVSSIYELFKCSYSSYFYLESMLNEHFSDFSDYSITEEFNDFFRFIYSPDNLFLRQINAFSSYDICNVIADKYRLMGINIENENINSDNIEMCIMTVNFICLADRIDRRSLSIDDMFFIYKFNKFDKLDVMDVLYF